MNSVWDNYPTDYRSGEVEVTTAAVRGGECVSVVGLSGAGKSNLLGFIHNRVAASRSGAGLCFILVDCNRLSEFTSTALFRQIRLALGDSDAVMDEMERLEELLGGRLAEDFDSLCILFDHFDVLSDPADRAMFNNLRVLRDLHKYQLTYVIATRCPLKQYSELSELFYAHTLWLGPLSKSDARWNVTSYSQRKGITWDDNVAQALISIAWGYPSLLRAACEAHADGASLDLKSLVEHPAVIKRVKEFWANEPSDEHLRNSGLEGQPLLMAARTPKFDTFHYTAKEQLLLDYMLAHPNQLCEKDELIRAVWPENQIFEHGIRDDSLAQIVRRLRVKIEPDPSNPRHIHTVPGRGYLFRPN